MATNKKFLSSASKTVCFCSPSTLPGAFKCRLHRPTAPSTSSSSLPPLPPRRVVVSSSYSSSASLTLSRTSSGAAVIRAESPKSKNMKNLMATLKVSLMKAYLMQTITPPSCQRKSGFQPNKPSRFSPYVGHSHRVAVS
ncbi:uncharacterized protein LOC126683009 [Mercurialis annua]|uniref:uncharacterized protein LOC126683009 n=1 Tax=Mercurialis annua TaxID=3986 RepID=UPI0024AE46BD|nr:uncharacterized protein LOC126683009 [Mercurialis annua]